MSFASSRQLRHAVLETASCAFIREMTQRRTAQTNLLVWVCVGQTASRLSFRVELFEVRVFVCRYHFRDFPVRHKKVREGSDCFFLTRADVVMSAKDNTDKASQVGRREKLPLSSSKVLYFANN